MRITRLPSNITNYYIARERYEERVPWVRTPDLAKLELARPIAVVNGAFDVLHAGHMRVIFAARKRAKTVVVAMDADARVGRKGTGRPVQTFPERLTALSYMPVDYVVEIESDRDMKRLLDTVQPDLRVQGYDHSVHESKFPKWKKCFVRVGSMRTSKIIERCKRCG